MVGTLIVLALFPTLLLTFFALVMASPLGGWFDANDAD